MKALRFFLLVMLALTLPFRGAVAQLACCDGLPTGAEVALVQPADAGHDHDHGAAQHHGHDMHGMDGSAGDTTPDGCHHCVASCSSPAFASAPLLMPVPVAVAQARFPALSAPPPSHPGEGQERPPRTV